MRFYRNIVDSESHLDDNDENAYGKYGFSTYERLLCHGHIWWCLIRLSASGAFCKHFTLVSVFVYEPTAWWLTGTITIPHCCQPNSEWASPVDSVFCDASVHVMSFLVVLMREQPLCWH
ncbi:unnamed protein product [Camellia sinensis]